jgi:hypothetical protein
VKLEALTVYKIIYSVVDEKTEGTYKSLMSRHTVSTKLNNSKNDDAESAAPLRIEEQKQDSLF